MKVSKVYTDFFNQEYGTFDTPPTQKEMGEVLGVYLRLLPDYRGRESSQEKVNETGTTDEARLLKTIWGIRKDFNIPQSLNTVLLGELARLEETHEAVLESLLSYQVENENWKDTELMYGDYPIKTGDFAEYRIIDMIYLLFTRIKNIKACMLCAQTSEASPMMTEIKVNALRAQLESMLKKYLTGRLSQLVTQNHSGVYEGFYIYGDGDTLQLQYFLIDHIQDANKRLQHIQIKRGLLLAEPTPTDLTQFAELEIDF